MKQASKLIRQHILSLMSDGQFHSGEVIAQQVGLSRTAVAGHISQLTDWGLDVFKVKGKGYRLNQGFSLLRAENIKKHLTKPGLSLIQVEPVLASTNSEMKKRIATARHDLADGDAILAEVQTDGKGRHGRKWLAPVGGSLTFSMYWSFPDGYQSMAGLSLLVGVAICEALRKFNIEDAQLKWPNDIYLNGAKLAGVLIEVEGQIGATAHSVIGIGLNVNVPDSQYDVGQPHSDLTGYLGETPDRNELAAAIIESLRELLPEFTQRGFGKFVPYWEALDLFADKKIVLQMGDKRFSGIDRGVDQSGALLVETVDGITRFHGGEVSLRGI
ncbi:bifunctional biotin--[acetyl-CoA-carboxylase] ligase/biotin operon repressor BirA [Alteromonas sp. C1M14]|uniref:bifunctional biotin--[acetyl-CoA-carboxylase] ligase/biotin operon repressor BirA n=1 Tax=Alteromonas sp. C1M14 TaxID=2841567 RepID=UPI001C07F7A1|nr:bifunctional biotin--[acetyl-CoA-carboxylase] ligase/biotin operon repressor BirA [Alteromonas sp. C1M14]MBU2977495.1 bifunctional biotin--[acetyl-CoA-carboxylase] ligase/biotin operon repressor BirA [Alteromonas sp. C1M14]